MTSASPHARAVVRQVLDIVGGPGRGAAGRTAALLGIYESTVRTWLSVGRIPAKWQPRLIELGRELGRPLRPEHFFDLVDAPEPGTASSRAGDEPPAMAASPRAA